MPTDTPRRPNPELLDVLIVGSGFAGIGMAVALKQAGRDRFVILEKGHDVGGVWRDNQYPGAACDVPSHLYSFSFEPNPEWSRVFATQPEILAYLQRCATRHQLRQHLHCHAEVSRLDFDEAKGVWHATLHDGRQFRARVVVNGTGQLSRPAWPRIPGLSEFGGPVFHSARWNPDCTLSGRRVAVIGTGASAVQFVPAIAPEVARLQVFQRSASHVLPRPDRAYRPWEKAVFRRWPWAMRLHRAWIYASYEYQAVAFTRFHGLMKWAVGRPFQRLLRAQVPDPVLRQALTPDYPIGCKRILLSSDYLRTLAQPHVTVTTTGIARVRPEGIETTDGTLHPADVIILGTGFAATEFLAPMEVRGRQGRRLQEVWQPGASAYLGLSVPGFPNFFMLYGPNTNLGHNSIVYMLESQIAHVMACLNAMDRHGADQIEVRDDALSTFDAEVQGRLAHTVWRGCKSWYIDANGRNTTNWPDFTFRYRQRTAQAPETAYHLARHAT